MNNMSHKVAAALLLSGVCAQASALDLGNYNGTQFSVGGYIKGQGVFSNPDDGDSRFDGTARQSRINFATARSVEGHSLKGLIEGDFYGGNASGTTYDWRLRHAYIKVDDLTIGQTWSGQFLGKMANDIIDFAAADRGTLAYGNPRMTLVHYELGGARFSFQDPIYDDADMPDMVFNYRYTAASGNVLGALLSVREIENDEVAAGIALAGKLMLGRDDIRFNAHYGEGLAAFTGIGSDVSAEDSIDQFGFNLAYRHLWSDKLRSSVQYTQTEVDDASDTEYQSVHANLIYNLIPELEFGIEWRKYELTPDAAYNGQQIELMAKYSF